MLGFSPISSAPLGGTPDAPTGTADFSFYLKPGAAQLVRNDVDFPPASVTYAALFTNSNTFYTQEVAHASSGQNLTPSRYDNAPSYYTHALGLNLTPSLFTNDQAFYGHGVVNAGALAAARFDNAQTFYPQQLSTTQTLTASRFDNAQTFYPQQLSTTQTLTASRFDNAQTWYSHSFATPQNLTASRFDNVRTWNGHLLYLGALTLRAERFTQTRTWPVHQVSTTKALTAQLLENTQTWPVPVVTRGAVSIQAPYYETAQTFYAASLTRDFTLVASRHDNSQSWYSHRIDLTLPVALLPSSNRFYEHLIGLEQYLVAQRYQHQPVFYGFRLSMYQQSSYELSAGYYYPQYRVRPQAAYAKADTAVTRLAASALLQSTRV